MGDAVGRGGTMVIGRGAGSARAESNHGSVRVGHQQAGGQWWSVGRGQWTRRRSVVSGQDPWISGQYLRRVSQEGRDPCPAEEGEGEEGEGGRLGREGRRKGDEADEAEEGWRGRRGRGPEHGRWEGRA